MKPCKSNRVRGAVRQKGFVRDDTDHEKWFYQNKEGQKTHLWLKLSHGETECRPRELRKMLRTLQLSEKEFFGLIDCGFTEEDMEKHFLALRLRRTSR